MESAVTVHAKGRAWPEFETHESASLGGEPGANPGRPRRCEGGRGGDDDATATRNVVGRRPPRAIPEPEDLPGAINRWGPSRVGERECSARRADRAAAHFGTQRASGTWRAGGPIASHSSFSRARLRLPREEAPCVTH